MREEVLYWLYMEEMDFFSGKLYREIDAAREDDIRRAAHGEPSYYEEGYGAKDEEGTPRPTVVSKGVVGPEGEVEKLDEFLYSDLVPGNVTAFLEGAGQGQSVLDDFGGIALPR
ncbi:hypothetical protein NGA_0717600 [Nannochloropsis gaditana CCMP526]|uniref:uncharacterized protein n=1 Tax=Nannochloropsis gaditana (strain CCMP526) TaxID=1093141 RepID=UPI00029F7F96|nr:hypothetical protein NGA_0717600 [Nannochloropsis gaditana CCMP526]EKU23219.1 hypothetical protein NGA_0717600 [Nannochloropsis gaditana CCMP526]|eukprot:XP_005852613.1 hypothetical protein NGA_0717600 [Nannochloropsis gaditana CCMP526]